MFKTDPRDHLMAKMLTLTNREFLRNYRQWKVQLESGMVDKIVVRENGNRFEFRMLKEKRRGEMSWQEILDWLGKEGPKIRVKRVPFKLRL